jgi:hypothetical protein
MQAAGVLMAMQAAGVPMAEALAWEALLEGRMVPTGHPDQAAQRGCKSQVLEYELVNATGIADSSSSRSETSARSGEVPR